MLLRLPPVLLWHMKIFQCMGLFPFRINNKTSSNRIEYFVRFWPLVLLVFFNVHTIHTLLSDLNFLYKDDAFGYFNDVLKLDVAHVTIVSILMESLLRRDHLQNFWLLYNQLVEEKHTQTHRSKESFLQGVLENLRFLGVFYVVHGSEVIILVLFLTKDTITEHLALFWSMFYPFIYMLHFRNMQFILHFEIIRQQLEQLKNELAEIVDYTQFATKVEPFQGFSEFLRVKLHEKQLKYQKIYEMFQNLQHAFGVSMVCVLLTMYVRILVDGYFAYYTSIYYGSTYEQYLMLPMILELPAFLIVSKNCMNVVKHLTFQLHNIMRKPDDISLSVQIQNFSLQILHSQIKITGVGILTMDGYLLTRIVGSITTYMIFFIQFMPKVRPYKATEEEMEGVSNPYGNEVPYHVRD